MALPNNPRLAAEAKAAVATTLQPPAPRPNSGPALDDLLFYAEQLCNSAGDIGDRSFRGRTAHLRELQAVCRAIRTAQGTGESLEEVLRG